jgi:hypothetical protein
MNPPIAVAHTGLAYLPDPLFKVGLSGATRLVVVGGRIDLKYPAGPPDRHTPFTMHRVNQLALPGRP